MHDAIRETRYRPETAPSLAVYPTSKKKKNFDSKREAGDGRTMALSFSVDSREN
jgi:hypothetical protein